MTPRSSPTVSVVIPCHNSRHFLAETVASVAAQHFTAFEVVLVDDGSTDDTRALIDRLIQVYPALEMRAVDKPCGGVASARNAGIAVARGRYILPLDADDLIAPGMLAEAAALLDAGPSIGIVCTDREDFGDIQRQVPSGPFELDRLKYFNQVGYCSMYRREVWDAVGGYRSNVDGFDDWDFWIAAALRGARATHLRRAHLRHRRRGDSFMWTLLDRYEVLHARIILNNADAYSAAEVAMARDYLDHGTPAPLLQSARFIYLTRYYEGYAIAPTAPALITR